MKLESGHLSTRRVRGARIARRVFQADDASAWIERGLAPGGQRHAGVRPVLMMAVMPLSASQSRAEDFVPRRAHQPGRRACVQGIKEQSAGADFIGETLRRQHAAQVEVDGFYKHWPDAGIQKDELLPVQFRNIEPKKAAFSRTCRGLSRKATRMPGSFPCAPFKSV